MGSIQPILSFSCFRGYFREFRVMTRPSKRIPYMKPKYIQRIHTVILIHFITEKKWSLYTRRRREAKNNRGCNRRLRIQPAHAQTFSLVASLSTCSAEVVCFASNPPWLRASLLAHPAPVPLFVHFADFRKFCVGDGGG
jgi:hypothetical protein